MQVSLTLSYRNITRFNQFKNHGDRIVSGNSTGTISYTYPITGLGTDSSKWVTGILAPNGKIYCPAYNETAILVIDTTNDSSYTFGNIAGTGKHIASVLVGDIIYCLPWNSTSFLKIDTRTEKITTFGSVTANNYISIILAQNGKLYCTPNTASDYLVVDPTDDSISTVNHSGNTISYRAPVLASNGKIYAPGYDEVANNMLVIDTNTNTDYNLTFTTDGLVLPFQTGALALNGKCYWCPRNANYGMILDPFTDTITYTPDVPGVTATAYYSSVFGPDGNIYGLGQDNSEELFQIDTSTNTGSVVGGVWTTAGLNSYQHMVLAPNGSLYAIPARASQVLKISFSGVTQGFDENFLMSGYFNYK